MANVLSLFDGIACGYLAMQKAGIHVDKYIAYEIDKYAIQTAMYNFPDIEEKGDVFNGNFSEYKGLIDYLIGGSPCVKWSIAKGTDRETEPCGEGWDWFCQYTRALQEAEPKYFLYENNKSMSDEIRNSISNTFGFEPVCINSSLVSEQNRQRLYWLGRRNADGTYSRIDVEQPSDLGIMLRDILETKCELAQPIAHGENGKASCLTSSYYKGDTIEHALTKSKRTLCAEPVRELSEKEINYLFCDYPERRLGFMNRPGQDDKSKCVVANYYKGVPYNVCAEPVRVGTFPMENGEISNSKQFRIYSDIGKSTTICGNGGGLGAKTGLYAIPFDCRCFATPCDWNESGEPEKAISCTNGKTYTVYKVTNGMIRIKGKLYPVKLIDGFYIIRKLTVRECARLQTIPEWYIFPCSETQSLRQIGNGWTISVIQWLLEATLI